MDRFEHAASKTRVDPLLGPTAADEIPDDGRRSPPPPEGWGAWARALFIRQGVIKDPGAAGAPPRGGKDATDAP